MRLLGTIAASGYLAFCVTAHAEDDFIASVRLRGGFDSNPQFSNGGGVGGSAFIGTDTALIAGTKGDNYSYGVAAEAGTTQYANPLMVPSLNGKVVLRATYGDDDAKIYSTSTVSDVNSYNLRSSDLIQSVKGELKDDNFKLFATVEGARSSLNQTNAIFQDFLPNPQVYLRGTLIPGVSYVRDKFELGMSVSLSARKYDRELDDFGYHRDNERVQPFIFTKYENENIEFFAAVSKLYATFHDVDFSNVNTTLFDTKLTWRINPLVFDFAAYRRAGETTFPVSPITIDSAFTAKAAWTADPKLTLTAGGGFSRSDYLDSPYSQKTWTYGVGASHDLGGGYALGLDLSRAQGTLLSGDKANAIIISSSLTKKFTPLEKEAAKDTKDKKADTKG